MSRRGSPQILVLVAAALLFLYGYYEYNGLKTLLRKSEDSAKRMKLEEDNMSTQLQAANDQKARVEATLQRERENFKKAKDELLSAKSDVEMKCKQEKKDLASRFTKLSEELSALKVNYEKLQEELQKHQGLDAQYAEERQKLSAENKRLKQEGDNEVAVLRDEIANLKRQSKALQHQLQNSPQKFVGHEADKDIKDNALPKDDRMPQWNGNNRIANLDNAVLPDVGRNKENRGNAEDEVPMQINKPDNIERKAYFEPKEPKPDHPIVKRPFHAGVVEKAVNQVAPPDVDNDAVNEVEQHDRLKRGAKMRLEVDDMVAGRHRNPVFPDDQHGRESHNIRAPGVVDHGRAEKLGHVGGRNIDFDNVHGQVEKPMQIAEPAAQHEEEDQLQGPHNDRADEKDDDGNEDDNDEEYQYGEREKKERGAVPDRKLHLGHQAGPHGAPMEDDEGNGL